MKRFNIFFLVIICLAMVAAAFAAEQGKRVSDPNNRQLQYNSPNPAASDCTTTTTTKGAIKTVTVAGYSHLCFATMTSATNHTLIRAKRHLGSNTAYMPTPPGVDCIGLNKDMSTVVIKPYSSVSRAYTTCIEMEKGGKTP